MWSAQEMKYHIIILDLLAVKLSIQTFTKYRDVKAIPVQVGDIAVLTYLMKMGGGTQNLKMVWLAKEILGISFEVGDHSYYRLPSKRIECISRLGI